MLVRQLERHVVVEIDREQLVVFPDRVQNGGDGGQHCVRLRTHALTAIHDEAQRDWRVTAIKGRSGLEAAILVHVEVARVQVAHRAAVTVSDDDRDDDKLCVDPDDGLQQQEKSGQQKPHGNLLSAAG